MINAGGQKRVPGMKIKNGMDLGSRMEKCKLRKKKTVQN